MVPFIRRSLAQSLYRDLLFRKFCRLELGGDVPEASTLGRFRTQLVKQELWEVLLAEINDQLSAKNIIMTEGRIKEGANKYHSRSTFDCN